MRKQNNRLYQTLFVLIVLLLFFPLIQQSVSLFSVKQLNGSIEKAEKPTLSFEGWWNETYQPKEELYLNQNFGFRNSFVRLNNQLSYWFFDKTSAKSVIIGKENYLYETGYLKSYFGDYNVGEKKVQSSVEKLKAISDTLQKLGKELLVICAPGKASFYPEYIPEHYFNERKSAEALTNYSLFSKELKAKGVNCIDFNALFIKMKDTSRYSLYPKTGIHWSQYGAIFAADSILTYLEKSFNKPLPKMVCDSFIVTSDLQFYDRDIEEGMNLMYDLPNMQMAYPYVSFDTSKSSKLNVLVISDSFFWPLYDVGMSEVAFNDAGFWYYNKEEYTKGKLRQSRKVAALALAEELEKKDAIIIMATESNIGNLGWGFIESAYALFYDQNGHLQREKEQRILAYIELIKKDESWYKSVVEKAELNKIPIDSMLFLDAKYMVEMDGK